MMKKIFYICCFVGLAACATDLTTDPSQTGKSGAIRLGISAAENAIFTRSVSSDEVENRIQNIYIFVFDARGEVEYRRFYDDLNKAGATDATMIYDLLSGEKTVSVIANVNNTVVDLTSTQLDAITTQTELQNRIATLQDNYIERGTNFLMSGTAAISVVANQTAQLTVNLKRIDAKVYFRITASTASFPSLTFTARDWRICNVPKKAEVLESTATDLFSDDAANYFNSEYANFEGENGNMLSFYIMESKISPLAQIPTQIDGTALDYNSQYALRDKQNKTDNGDGTLTNGDYTYARQNAPYVEIRGTLRYRVNSDVERTADVHYIVHLGAVEGVNDYNTKRNTAYAYTLKVVSAEKILVEVDTGVENRPGEEGDVINANRIIELDACNEVFSVIFKKSDIDNTLTWNVYTPFSKGGEQENPSDYKWITFRINNKSGSSYTDNLRTYIGDQNIYTQELTLDEYMEDIRNASDKLLNVDQLVAFLKLCKERDNAGNTNTLFDTNSRVHFTAYVNEYYYQTNPNDAAQTAENGLWKKFVNQKERILNILSDLKYSPDGMSSKSNALYSIRQSSIQTMYNRTSTENYTAWGTQPIQDPTPLIFEKSATTTQGSSAAYNDTNNGRQNSINMWNGQTQWDTYIDVDKTTRDLKSDYEAAKYKCLRLNRDMNGDNTIDENEIQWYLASINQLTDIWIGENSFDPMARLYKLTTWDEQWYASSTVPERTYTFLVGYKDNAQILWSSEGSSIGPLANTKGINTPVYYRCVRNLGMAPETPKAALPDELVHYDNATHIISLSRIDSKSIRGYFQTDELPEHHEREAANKPYWKFEVLPYASGSGYTWDNVRDRIRNGQEVCPEGYRVPNQRELSLMYTRIGNDGNWTARNHFSRTRFQFNNSSGTYRPGFSVSNNHTVFYLINNVYDDTGGVRCVKDVK